jgi:hypothetical protein
MPRKARRRGTRRTVSGTVHVVPAGAAESRSPSSTRPPVSLTGDPLGICLDTTPRGPFPRPQSFHGAHSVSRSWHFPVLGAIDRRSGESMTDNRLSKRLRGYPRAHRKYLGTDRYECSSKAIVDWRVGCGVESASTLSPGLRTMTLKLTSSETVTGWPLVRYELEKAMSWVVSMCVNRLECSGKVDLGALG